MALMENRSALWTSAGVLGVALGRLFCALAGTMLAIAMVTRLPGRGTNTLPGLLPVVFADSRFLPAFFLLSGVLAAAAGIGLLRRRRYGRTLALSCAVLAGVWSVFAVFHLWLSAYSTANHRSAFFRF